MSSKLRQQLEQGNSFANKLKPDYIRRAKDRKFYGYTFDQANGRHPLSLALDFFTKDGNRFGIYYMEIASPVLFDLGTEGSGQKIVLRVSSSEITIEGKHLSPIYEYILEQRLVWLKEQDVSFVEVVEDEPVIEKIEVKDR